MIVKLVEADLETKFGTYREHLFYDGLTESIALVMGDIEGKEDVFCRIHSHCLSAHVFSSIECDCREQLEMAQFTIEQEGAGIIIWLDQEGRSNGHMALLASDKLKREGMGQSEAYKKTGYKDDARDFTNAAEILEVLNVKSIALISNNPKKKQKMIDKGLPVSKTVPVHLSPEEDSQLWKYYQDKLANSHTIKLG